MIERCPSHIISRYKKPIDNPSIQGLFEPGLGLLYNAYGVGMWAGVLGLAYQDNNILNTVQGGGWRIPTRDDIDHLINHIPYNDNGILGRKGSKLRSTRQNSNVHHQGLDITEGEFTGLWTWSGSAYPEDEFIGTHAGWCTRRTWYGATTYLNYDSVGFKALPAGYADIHSYKNEYGETIFQDVEIKPTGGEFVMWVNDPTYTGKSRLNLLHLLYDKQQIHTKPFYNFGSLASVRLCRNKGINPATGIMTDYENNEYRYITIGNLNWMQHSLRTTKFMNGNDISEITNTQDIYDFATNKIGGWVKPFWSPKATVIKHYPLGYGSLD